MLLGACGGTITKRPNMEDAAYWQRNSASSALYLQGPKAQQMLHQDIARCTSDIRELENLGEIRRAIPPNYNSGNTLEERSASQRKLDEWDSPERDGYLRAEHGEYFDFETCMISKGWERVDYLPYSAVDKANKDYLDRHGKKKKRSLGDRENVTSLTPTKKPQTGPNVNE